MREPPLLPSYGGWSSPLTMLRIIDLIWANYGL